jgi:2-octaprenyl-6-methoxyphenol hydroxylase
MTKANAAKPKAGKPESAKPAVLIAGGGIVGLTLAVALMEAAGNAVRVCVQDPALASDRVDARAYAIAAGPRRMLDHLGIWSDCVDAAQPITAMDITDSPLDDLARPMLLSFEGEREADMPFAHMVPGSSLMSALTRRARALDVSLESAPVEGFRDHGSHVVALTKGVESAPYALLVAADGGESKLRAAAGIGFHGWGYPQLALVGTMAHDRPHQGRAVEHFLPAGPFAQLPLPGNRSSFVWTEDPDVARRMLRLSPERQTEEIERRFGLSLGRVTLETPLKAYPLRFGLARQFHKGRVALMGDSAHVIHPIAGQGLNLGLADAAALAEAIVDHLRLGFDPGSTETLIAYDRARRPDTARMAFVTDVLNRLFSNDLGPLRLVRDFGLGLVQRLPELKRQIIGAAAAGNASQPRLMRGEAL